MSDLKAALKGSIEPDAPNGHRNVFMALVAAQQEMSAPLKDATNPAFRSKYADLSSVVNAVAPALNKHGVCFVHYTLREDGREFMVTALVHGESETKVECAIPVIVGKNDMQGYKSATTYAKRIGLESVTGVAPEDDDGNAAARNPPARSRTVSRSEPPPDPDTGEVFDGQQPPARSIGDALNSGMADAWLDAIKDQLPFDCADMAKLEPHQVGQYWNAVADALVDAFHKLKSPAGVSKQWDKRDGLIMEMQHANPPAYHRVLDGFNDRLRELDDPARYLAAG
jgi:hypothetical protein